MTATNANKGDESAPANHDLEGGPRRSLKDALVNHPYIYLVTKKTARDCKHNWSILGSRWGYEGSSEDSEHA
jgi:hypothetical protein